jgi:hypothetical protein
MYGSGLETCGFERLRVREDAELPRGADSCRLGQGISAWFRRRRSRSRRRKDPGCNPRPTCPCEPPICASAAPAASSSRWRSRHRDGGRLPSTNQAARLALRDQCNSRRLAENPVGEPMRTGESDSRVPLPLLVSAQRSVDRRRGRRQRCGLCMKRNGWRLALRLLRGLHGSAVINALLRPKPGATRAGGGGRVPGSRPRRSSPDRGSAWQHRGAPGPPATDRRPRSRSGRP